MAEMKQWRCKHDHILGFIQLNSDKVAELHLLRQALDMDVETPAEVDVLGQVIGNVMVRCSICNDVKPWGVSVNGLVAIFGEMSDKDVYEFSKRLLKKGGGEWLE